MSVINQALKKAQRQQLARSMPRPSSLSPLPTSAARQRRRLLRTRGVAGAVGLLGGAVVVYAWITGPSLPLSVHVPAQPQAASSRSVAPSATLPSVATTPSELPAAVPGVPARAVWHGPDALLSHRPVAPVASEGAALPADRPGSAVVPEVASAAPRQSAAVPSLPEPATAANLSRSHPGNVLRVPAATPASAQPAALLEQALRQQAAGNLPQARLLLEQVVGLDPAAKVAYNSLGNVYYQQEQYEQAATMYGQALAIDPHYVKARNNLGNTYMRLGMDSRALTELQQALQTDTAYGLTHYNLACLYARAGDGSTAARYLRQAIEREPQAREWAQSDVDFLPVRTAPEMQYVLGGVR